MLTDKSIRCIIRQIQNGRGTKVVAEESNISQRHVQRLWAEYVKTGTAHPPEPHGAAKEARTLGCKGNDGAGHPPLLAGRDTADSEGARKGGDVI